MLATVNATQVNTKQTQTHIEIKLERQKYQQSAGIPYVM